RGPLPDRRDESGATRRAATRQKSPAGPVMPDSASVGPNSHTDPPSGAVSSHRTGAGWSPATVIAYGRRRGGHLPPPPAGRRGRLAQGGRGAPPGKPLASRRPRGPQPRHVPQPVGVGEVQG